MFDIGWSELLVLGALAGYFRGWVDELLLWVSELFLALPWLYLLLAARAFLPLSISPAQAFLLLVAVIVLTARSQVSDRVHMLDLGANTQATPEHLFQYAVMGSIIAADINRLDNPRVALLNIGAEDIKGHETVKEAAALLNASALNYVGFIEGNDLMSGKTDVVVTDGFTGNVALKTMEGTVAVCKYHLRAAFGRNWLTRLQALVAAPVLKHLGAQMDSRKYNGATLAGLNGIVIKSHGSADAFAFQHAIDTAIVEVRNQLPQQIGKLLEREAG